MSSSFSIRHIGPSQETQQEMLQAIGIESHEALIEEIIPSFIREKKPLSLPPAMNEASYLHHIREVANKNELFHNFIGQGFYGTILPPMIQRHVLENPSWYTPYTPYQAEISQGRLEALLNFQTCIIELTGLPVSNCSLLDEATATAEAMGLMFNGRSRKAIKAGVRKLFVDDSLFIQNKEVLSARCEPLEVEIVWGNFDEIALDETFFGAIVQYPTMNGELRDYGAFTQHAHEHGVLVTAVVDLMSLALLEAPGTWGADIAVGTSQRFGIPMGYGGPAAAFLATKENFKRNIPGRIIGISKDKSGAPALRMALQTREQHIKRERATSNICTAQALLATMASFYAIYHGEEGIKTIAKKIHHHASLIYEGVSQLGYVVTNDSFFDTIEVQHDHVPQNVLNKALVERRINVFYKGQNKILISTDEETREEQVELLLEAFAVACGKEKPTLPHNVKSRIPTHLQRTTPFLVAPVFNSYRSETALMRYMKLLEKKDLSLTNCMIPLGSCTMKLNPAATMLPLSFPELAGIHPFVPQEQAAGYLQIMHDLEDYLSKITGFSKCSLQPNSGANGEFTGLLIIRKYLEQKNEGHRNIVLIPASAHGTNPASAIMAGCRVVVVACNEDGDISMDDLKAKVEEHKSNLAALMITYPSTHGVYEENVVEICDLIHECGGQIYMDGANMNAQVGFTSPGKIGADVCHLNLHKTFAIPHGGGGPGVGPVCVAEHLTPFLPSHPFLKVGGAKAVQSVASAPFGSALVSAISYGYIRLMGREGLEEATRVAMLSANYLADALEKVGYKILYKGQNGRVAHELIIDCRVFKKATGITDEDIAKRLMDYNFHAPTLSFPIHGTLMVEPTESEPKEELDRFVDAMKSILQEVKEVEVGEFPQDDNVLKNAPHTVARLTADEWSSPYSRSKAAFPTKILPRDKYYAPVGRVDNGYGDRNLVCSCLQSMHEFE